MIAQTIHMCYWPSGYRQFREKEDLKIMVTNQCKLSSTECINHYSEHRNKSQSETGYRSVLIHGLTRVHHMTRGNRKHSRGPAEGSQRIESAHPGKAEHAALRRRLAFRGLSRRSDKRHTHFILRTKTYPKLEERALFLRKLPKQVNTTRCYLKVPIPLVQLIQPMRIAARK